MLQLDAHFHLFEQKLEPVDVLYFGDVRLDAHVDLQRGLHVHHREVIVLFALHCALGLKHDREQRQKLPVIVNLHAIKSGLIDPFLFLLTYHGDPVVQDQGQDFGLLVD